MAQQTVIPYVLDIYHDNSLGRDESATINGLKTTPIIGIILKASQETSDLKVVSRAPIVAGAGFLRGFYHFNEPEVKVSVAAQAMLFLGAIRAAGLTDADLVCLDWEPPGMSLAAAIEWCDRVEQETHRACLIYGGSVPKELMPKASAAQRDALSKRRFWLSEYGPEPRMIDENHQPLPWPAPFLWQYTDGSNGPEPHTLVGLERHADLSTSSMTPVELRQYWSGAA
jgi:lysozyme